MPQSEMISVTKVSLVWRTLSFRLIAHVLICFFQMSDTGQKHANGILYQLIRGDNSWTEFDLRRIFSYKPYWGQSENKDFDRLCLLLNKFRNVDSVFDLASEGLVHRIHMYVCVRVSVCVCICVHINTVWISSFIYKRAGLCILQ